MPLSGSLKEAGANFMEMLKLTAVVATDRNRLIGRDNDLPWDCPEELQAFKQLTIGQTLLMGRQTFESIVKRRKAPLVERRHLVLTHRPGPPCPDVQYLPSLEEALVCARQKTLFVIGGASVYAQCARLLDTLYLSLIPGEHTGDTYLPDLGYCWNIVAEEGFKTFVRYKFQRDEQAHFDWSQLGAQKT